MLDQRRILLRALIELHHRLVDLLDAGALLQACIADFADSNREFFGSPVAATGWRTLLQSGVPLEDAERQALERALGIVLNVFRTCTQVQEEAVPLETLLQDRPGAAFPAIEPDAALLAMLDEPDGAEALAFAKGVTIYRRLVENGHIRGDQVEAHIVGVLERVPARTDLMRSAVEAAKSMALIQLECVVGGAAA